MKIRAVQGMPFSTGPPLRDCRSTTFVMRRTSTMQNTPVLPFAPTRSPFLGMRPCWAPGFLVCSAQCFSKSFMFFDFMTTAWHIRCASSRGNGFKVRSIIRFSRAVELLPGGNHGMAMNSYRILHVPGITAGKGHHDGNIAGMGHAEQQLIALLQAING